MNQREAVIKTMEMNGGFATLGYLYQNVLKIKECRWKTKTPFASIRRIVQDDKYFFRIKPGLWALKSHRNKLPLEILESLEAPQNDKMQQEFNHSYYQGLLVEIGNLKKYKTFIPNQDKNRSFLNRRLGDLATVERIYKFSFEEIVSKAQTIDVIWFNIRKMPAKLFEVEHSTDIYNSLLKFVELQDFYSDYFIVADKHGLQEYNKKLTLDAFRPIKERVKFLNYDDLSELHTKTFEAVALEERVF